MLKKRLVVTIVSIAIVSFILGTMFNLNLITTAKKDNDPKPVWPTYITGVNATALPETWNVNVTNWPVSTSVNVWWHEHIDDESAASRAYDANGFGQLHLLAHQHGLETTQTVRILIYALLWNGTHTTFYTSVVTEITLDKDNPDAIMTIPVPSDQFVFTVGSEYECRVSLSFYLTWA